MTSHAFDLHWRYDRDADAERYELRLVNRSAGPVSGMRLGVSGPARIARDAVEGGIVADQLSSWCEIAAPDALALAPGESWTIIVRRCDFPMHHWTDGAAGAVVTLADGSTHVARIIPAGVRRRGVFALSAPATGIPGPAIIPWPREVAVSGAIGAPTGFDIAATSPGGESARASFADLVGHLFPGEGLVRPAVEGGFAVRLEDAPALGAEAYELRFAAGAARVRAASETGFLYGLITLGQMARGASLHPERFAFPAEGVILDSPEMSWRGCHLDVARQFYATNEVSQFLRVLAWNKLNRFHWHLSDDEGWRVEIEAFPRLTEIGAWRDYGLPLPPMLGSSHQRSGGFYTQGAIRDIVRLGSALGIEIVPEIDVPGHCHALLVALPELSDPGENGLYHSIQHFPNNCLNPGVEAVYGALETIFAEMIALFPSRYFHVGADEVPGDAWAHSPKAQALLGTLGDSGAAALQAHFLARVQAFLARHGKVTGAWEEAAQGGGIDKDNSYLVGWHTVEASRRLAAEGYSVVVSPGQAYYLDMANGPEWEEPGAHWAGWSSPEKTYGFDPAAGWSATESARLLGVQACIWSEPMTDRGVFERLVFPRLSAIAETGWSGPQRRDWSRFAARAHLMPSLYRLPAEELR